MQHREVYCLENKQTYNGHLEAARELGLNALCVYRCCVGDQIQTKGFHFCYEDERDTYKILLSKKKRPIIVTNLKTGHSTRYPSVKEAVSQTGISYNTLYGILSGKVKKPRIGYSFKYSHE